MITDQKPLPNVKQRVQNHAVIILASGLSQRLGQPKQLLSKSSLPLVSYMIEQALSTQPRTVLVIIPKDYPFISKSITKDPAIHTIINPIPKVGMAHSLSLGIAALAEFNNSKPLERILIMGIDQVLLDESHLHRLLAGQSEVVASCYDNWQPLIGSPSIKPSKNNSQFNKTAEDNTKKGIIGLPLVINYQRLKSWQAALSGDKGLRHLIRALPSQQIETMVNNQLSYDIDTPEQLAYARQQGWLDP